MSKPIPGPWEVCELDTGRLAVVSTPTRLAVCQVKQTRDIAEPTASLIAQAPAYHEWAEAWLDRYYESGYSQLHIMEAMAELKAIHARATGGTPATKPVVAMHDDLSQAVEIISDLTAMIEMDPEYTPGTDLHTTGEVAKLFIARVKGGAA